MNMQADFDVVVVGGNADGLILAASLAESGRKVVLLESDMKVGGELLTESFLTSHRYDLSGGWQLNNSLAQLDVSGFEENHKRLLFPEIPLAFMFEKQAPLFFYRSLEHFQSQLTRSDSNKLAGLFGLGEDLYTAIHDRFTLGMSAGKIVGNQLSDLSKKTVKQLVNDYDFEDQRLRCALTYLPLALGYDIELPGSAAALAFSLYGITRLSVVDGGSGLLVNSLADRMIVKQGMIIESAKIVGVSRKKAEKKSIELEDGRVFSAPTIVFAKAGYVDAEIGTPNLHKNSLGVYRIYLDFSRSPTGFNPPVGNDDMLRQAYMVSFGFNREEDIYHYLKMIKAGQPPFIGGHVISNSFLNTANPVGVMRSLQQPLWRTSCHTTDPVKLKQQVTKASNIQVESSARVKMIGTSDLLEADDLGHHELPPVSIRPVPGSLIWQGVLPLQMRTLDTEGFRKSFERACIERISKAINGVNLDNLRFRLTWLANETKEPMLEINLIDMLTKKKSDNDYMTRTPGIYTNPYASLSRFTGMRSGQKLYSVLKDRLT